MNRRKQETEYEILRSLFSLFAPVYSPDRGIEYNLQRAVLLWGEARGRECIPGDTRPTEQRSPRPISAQPEGRHVFWAEALLLAPHRSIAGYARRSRLASAQNPLPRMYSYF